MSSPYSSPPSNLRSLRDRLVQAAKREGLAFGRLQQHVAVLVVAQLAARLTDAAGAPLLLVKGGSSLELRQGIGSSRRSRDLDAVARHDVAAIHEILLVTDETCQGTKSAAANAHGTRRVSPGDFTLLLRHLQPALPAATTRTATRATAGPAAATAVPKPRHAAAQQVSAVATSGQALPVGDIRTWARANGYSVGDRGRLPADIVAAWSDARDAARRS